MVTRHGTGWSSRAHPVLAPASRRSDAAGAHAAQIGGCVQLAPLLKVTVPRTLPVPTTFAPVIAALETAPVPAPSTRNVPPVWFRVNSDPAASSVFERRSRHI